MPFLKLFRNVSGPIVLIVSVSAVTEKHKPDRAEVYFSLSLSLSIKEQDNEMASSARLCILVEEYIDNLSGHSLES